MREIKFRCYIRALKKVYDITGLHYMGGSLSEVVIYDRGKFKWFSILDVDLMQYTGLVDKNGKGIFEGDILQNHFSKGVFNWLVVFENGCFGIRNIGVDGYLMDFFRADGQYYFNEREVIGNKFENQDLLT